MTQTTPTPGQPLSEADVSLLQPGDWLRDSARRLCRFDHLMGPDYIWARIGQGSSCGGGAESFTFLGRPDQDGWIAWNGGENPVPGVRVDVRFRDGDIRLNDQHSDKRWRHDPTIFLRFHIAAYRPHAPVSRPGDGVEGGWDRDLERGASAFIATSFGFSGPNDQDTPLQAAAREVGWMLSEVVDRIEWNKRGQAASALGRLATSIDGLVWPWEGDDPRHDQIRHSWRSFADNSADDDGRIDLTDVETCVAIGVMKAFQLLSPALTPPAEPVSRPAGEGEREAVARIVDPSAFLFAPDELPKGSRAQYDAFDKADCIIALLSPAAPDAGGGGEEDIMRTQEDWSALLYGRDSFIVRKGLWSEFVDSLPALQPGGER